MTTDSAEREELARIAYDAWLHTSGDKHWLAVADAFIDYMNRRAAPEAGREGVVFSLVSRQAEDEGLWFQPKYVTEAYLQKALRDLHSAIEGKTPTECAVDVLTTPSADVEAMAREEVYHWINAWFPGEAVPNAVDSLSTLITSVVAAAVGREREAK